MGTGCFPGVKSCLGVTLTPHPLLVRSSWKGRAIPLPPLWAVRPVQSLSACTRVNFTFFFYLPMPCTTKSLSSRTVATYRISIKKHKISVTLIRHTEADSFQKRYRALKRHKRKKIMLHANLAPKLLDRIKHIHVPTTLTREKESQVSIGSFWTNWWRGDYNELRSHSNSADKRIGAQTLYKLDKRVAPRNLDKCGHAYNYIEN